MLSWKALYTDNTSLPQYNEDGSENKYSNISRNILDRFILIDEKRSVKLILNLDRNKKLVYRRRVAMNMMNSIKDTCHIVGWQEKVGTKNKQFLCFVFESTGHIEVTDGFKERHPWYYPVIFLPEEEL